MIIERHELFKTVRAEQGKVLTRFEGKDVQIFEMVYAPLTMSDEALQARYEEKDKNDFLFEVKENE